MRAQRAPYRVRMSCRASRIGSVVAVLVVLMAGAGCSGSEGGSAQDGSAPATAAPTTTGTTVPPPPPTAVVVGEQVVDATFRQGVAKADDGWVFTTSFAMYRTDDALVRTAAVEAAIPPPLLAAGFDHLGDIDVVGDTVYVPLEQPDYEAGRQLMARYDLATLTYRDHVEVAQSHAAWVSVDPDTMTAWSMSGFSDDEVLRYDVAAGWAPLEPLRLDRMLDRVQGGDVRDGALWLSTDDATDGVYRVDLATGHVDALGSIGRIDGEAEGIDATPLAGGDLHVLTIDVAVVPIRLIALDVR